MLANDEVDFLSSKFKLLLVLVRLLVGLSLMWLPVELEIWLFGGKSPLLAAVAILSFFLASSKVSVSNPSMGANGGDGGMLFLYNIRIKPGF